MSRHFQLALRGTITWRPRKRTRTTKTSTWSCGSSPHALTDSLRCVHECRQPQHVTAQYCWRCCCRKWLDALICSCSHGAEDETWIVVFHMEIHVPPLRCSHVTLYIEFSFAYIFRLQFPYFFFFIRAQHCHTGWESLWCCIAVCSCPTSKQSITVSERQRGVPEEGFSCTETLPQIYLNFLLVQTPQRWFLFP